MTGRRIFVAVGLNSSALPGNAPAVMPNLTVLETKLVVFLLPRMRFYKRKSYQNKGLGRAVVSFQLGFAREAAGAMR
jgi:GNAT superfamily N-acetyltransferase